MPTQLTDPTDTNRVPAYTDARDQMIHALALAEHIVANAPELPADIKVVQRLSSLRSAEEADVEVYLHRRRDLVRTYQAFLGGEVSEEEYDTVRGKQTYTELKGRVFGCAFRVWALTAPKAAA